MRLNVTQNDIKFGQVHNPSNCAIAQSIRRKLKKQNIEHVDICVLPNTVNISVIERNNIVTYKSDMPKRGATFIHRFDNDMKVKPLTLTIPLVRVKAEPFTVAHV